MLDSVDQTVQLILDFHQSLHLICYCLSMAEQTAAMSAGKGSLKANGFIRKGMLKLQLTAV